MTQVGRSERESYKIGEELHQLLSELISILKEPYKSKVHKIKEYLDTLSNALLILTSRYEGGIRNKLVDLIEKGSKMALKDHETTEKDLKDNVKKAIDYLRGIEAELDKLINIEQVLEIKKEYISD